MLVPLSPRMISCALLAIGVLSACKSDAPTQSTDTTKIPNPTGQLNVGDLTSVNVNVNDACTNGIFHAARVVAVGTKSIILNDTLNPKTGFTAADFQRFSAKFDTLIYPMDVANFGEPTDIDGNGRVAIIFTRAVNELTPARSTSYVRGLAFSRDLFPRTGTARATGCAASNQGEYFYALTPDPTGTVNQNVRTAGFVDSVVPSVLAHELQHLINASRRLYVTNATAFEEKWLDEGLAHSAEELLFYRESGLSPRMNLDVTAIRSTSTIRTAFNLDMIGNTSRYKSYLMAPPSSSPYRFDDSLSTRGAIWSFLRYSVDRLNATDNFTAGNGTSVSGAGDITLTSGGTPAEYIATVVNMTVQTSGSILYTLKTTSATGDQVPLGSTVPAYLRVSSSDEDAGPRRDYAVESRVRQQERVVLTPMMAGAREWYAAQGGSHGLSPLRSTSSLSSLADPDAAFFFKLVNNTSNGLTNLQSAVGDVSSFVKDWSVSHAIDDVAALTTQYQQRSWNFHSIFPALGSGGNPYPLVVNPLTNNATTSGTVISGGAAYFQLSLPVNASVTVSLGASNGAVNSALQLIAVRTK